MCFLIEILLAKPSAAEMITGLIPRLNHDSLYVAIGILGATVMPHNLYLHSALVQTRRIGTTTAERRTACRFNLIDSAVALNGALLVNAAILVVAATVFYKRGIVVKEIQQAYLLLTPLLGSAASVVFALALLGSGQASTLTGTMAGQVVMEGFLNFRMRPWLRRLITRTLAVTPAALTIYIAGDQGTFRLLILSQVILSMQLPFAVIPLIHFTSDRARMGEFANRLWVRLLAWITAVVIVGLNIGLIYQNIADLVEGSPAHRFLILSIALPVCSGLLVLLGVVTFEPILTKRRLGRAPVTLPEPATGEIEPPVYHRILVPLDHTRLDRLAVGHAAALARTHGSTLYLFHVEEGVTSQVYGSLASTAEVEAGQDYLDRIAERLRKDGIKVVTEVTHSSDPKTGNRRLRPPDPSRPADYGRARTSALEGLDIWEYNQSSAP